MSSKYFSNRLDDQKTKGKRQVKGAKKIPTKRYNQKVSENQICLVLERLAEEIN